MRAVAVIAMAMVDVADLVLLVFFVFGIVDGTCDSAGTFIFFIFWDSGFSLIGYDTKSWLTSE